MRRVFVLAAALAASAPVLGAGISDYVLRAARMQQNTAGIANGRAAQIVYVGEHGGCSQVAVLWKGTPQQNFQVCGGRVQDKHSVAPSWPVDGPARQLLAMVVQQAMLAGQSAATDANGYLIAAQRANDFGQCATVDIKVSYDGDLVDRDIRKVCR